jgi:Na+-translocating ferredoxin:NAD+ oxidoreductase RnfD subunit
VSTPFFGRLSIHLDRIGFKPPHLFSKTHVRGRVWQKIAALLPLIVVSSAGQGWPAVKAFSVAVSGALIAEAVGAIFFKRLPAYHDGESVFIGIFCTLVLPLTLPTGFFFAAAFISVFAGREIFGGFGQAIVFPPAAGVLILFLGLPQMIQAFDFKEARALTSALPMSLDGSWDWRSLLLYPASAAPDEVSFLALLLGAFLLLAWKLVRWELPLLCAAGVCVIRMGLEKSEPLFLLSGGLWLTVFWGAAQTSAMPLTVIGRRVYALLAGLLAGLCPLGDETLRLLTGFAAASLLSPWIDMGFNPRQTQEAAAL